MNDDMNDAAAEVRRLRGEVAASRGVMVLILTLLAGRNIELQRTIISKIDGFSLDDEDHARIEGFERFKHRILESLNRPFSAVATHDDASPDTPPPTRG